MIFRPTVNQGTTAAPYLGFKEINFIEIREPDPKPDWADIYWNIECEIKESKYTNTLRVSGQLERDEEGNLVDCGLLNRLYYFLDCISFKGGLDVKGNWVDEDGNLIPDIVGYLNSKYMKKEGQRDFTAFGYIYKEQPKNPTDKPYTKIQSRVVQNTAEGRERLQSYIQFMKDKKHLKEAVDNYQPQPKSKTPF